jgi:hypothetical protein
MAAVANAIRNKSCDPTDSDCILYYNTSPHIIKYAYKKLATIPTTISPLDIYYVNYAVKPLVYHIIFMVDPDGMIQCHFTIKGKEGFGSGNTMDMTIHINDSKDHPSKHNTRNYTKKGLSSILIYYMVCEIKEEALTTQKLFIDSDASGGFWDKIGMRENPAYESNNPFEEGKGYEKVITLDKLHDYIDTQKSKIEDIIGRPIEQYRRFKRRSTYKSSKRRSTYKSPKRRSSKSRSPITRKSTQYRSRSRSPHKL